ncbi:YkvA family protein [Pseudomonas aeruginosa]|uniref:YkvA family protein n=2 Tax=Pseudomonas aeruginosa TaxID=287 RepID=UPI00235930FB|nr:DUF1232 domain-containing protein [Pseudomonas aeruginosa]WCY80587.1 DUF1232 domain-containing protein [Pseudomonas aeruginosa]
MHKSAIRPGSNFNRQGGSIFHQRQQYYAATDSDTPTWAKTTIYGALGYFISPIDVIPDITPIVGYTDDIGVLCAALAATATHIKAEHVTKAKETLKQWFS